MLLLKVLWYAVLFLKKNFTPFSGQTLRLLVVPKEDDILQLVSICALRPYVCMTKDKISIING